MARILALSSQVVRGHIGLSAIVPALQALGHEVWPLPTIVLSNHPGHRHAAGVRTPVDRLDAMLDALVANGWLGEVDAVLTGYLPTAEHAAFAARAIERVRQMRPQAIVLVDPVLGDEPKGLYIDPAAAAAIRDTLLPLADVTTPNRFELGWLSGRALGSLDEVESAARVPGVASVVVTSADVCDSPPPPPLLARGRGESILTVMLSSGTLTTYATPFHQLVPHGTGDLFSGLLLGHLLSGRDMSDAAGRAVTGVARAIEASVGHDELVLAGALPAITSAAPLSDHSASEWIAGVDGCPGGWLTVLRRLDDPKSAKAMIVRCFAEVLALPEAPRIIAVDMPIGLPERSIGGRRCDVEARAVLGQRKSAVFAVPSHAAVMETDYRRACEVALATSKPPRMVAKQAFHLFPKIREIDALMTPHLQDRVFEVHPEVAFWALNGERALEVAKKVKSQPHQPGLAFRRDLLVAAGYDRAFLAAHPFRWAEAGPDDLLDAAACSWTAARIAAGIARRFPADPPHDVRRLRMEIWG